MILDTSFIVDLMNGEEAAVEKLEGLKQRGEKLEVTSITAYELYLGVQRGTQPGKERQKILSLVDRLSANKIPFQWRHGEGSARIQADLENSGEMIEIQDLFLGSIVKEKGETILTGNPEHFERIEGVEVEGY